MANVKVSALSSLTAIAEEDTLIVNDYSEAAEKVKSATIPNIRLAMLLPGVDNTNDIGSAIKRIKSVYVAGDVYINSILQGKDVTAALHRKIVNIGDWNMDSTATVSVAHGIADFTKIRSVSAIVRNDSGTSMVPLTPQISGISTNSEGSINAIDATNVIMARSDPGSFATTAYDSTSYNRGWIILEYVD